MANRLEQEVVNYQQRRAAILGSLDAYRGWLDRYADIDAEQTLRLYDLAESLKQDRLVLAFVAEFSRGKSELINALFFADLKQRLLPSDAGRTTMCPTEIFHDADSKPYVRLLPIETRLRDDSIATLKRLPIEWSTISLDPSNAMQLSAALRSLAEVKRVPIPEARAMGLCDKDDAELARTGASDGKVEVPAWRYAQINFPHPLLQGGLTILDTPGLNALGSEPELTLSAIPNAHGVFFLLATDTGVTRSDLDIWENTVYRRVHHHIAVLNKIDMLWDELKSEAEIDAIIQRQIDQTAEQLRIPRHQVFAVSAQKALVGKIRDDQVLLERSGIARLEALLADKIIPSRQALLHQSVNREVQTMLEASRDGVLSRLKSVKSDAEQLSGFTGKNREVVTKLRDKLVIEKRGYDAVALNFKITRNLVQQQGRALLSELSGDVLNAMLEKSRENLDESWTTVSLTRGMNNLFGRINTQFAKVDKAAATILELLDSAYRRFEEQHGFPQLNPPKLDMDRHRQRLASLAQSTEMFCRDPLNLMLEKRFMVSKFYQSLVSEARTVFEMARLEADAWLRRTLDPLVMRIRDHKTQLELRVDNIRKVHDNLDNLQAKVAELKQQFDDLGKQHQEINSILRTFSRHAGSAVKTASPPSLHIVQAVA
ncbi:hypothetical protein SFMTTN_1182 [Sulfuriferula multivorans]|uniref:Dynamin N-terminal domain-containing protein n=1 Tax=Sulfuriferula multivorans TaxID=1559896 RepID=A0A401JCG8_9PROT|nr:dynamin family protein [Sulfuriferula multivorans]GBL45375.1 hypothetical protein SFMTTN_1182 [Sulfuriferula multivorans]